MIQIKINQSTLFENLRLRVKVAPFCTRRGPEGARKRKMEHEVVMALLGCPGDLIRASDRVSDGVLEMTYEVDPHIPFLSPAEREAIDQVVKLGASYEVVQSFVDAESDSDRDDELAFGGGGARGGGGTVASRPLYLAEGLYCRALRAGLEEQLSGYREAVVAIEAELVKDRNRPISYLRFKLWELHFHHTLPAMARLVKAVKRLRGGALFLALGRSREAAALLSRELAVCCASFLF